MVTMEKRHPEVVAVNDDQEVQVARRTLGEAERALEEAGRARSRLAPEAGKMKFDLDLLEANRTYRGAEEARDAARERVRQAEARARERIVAARQPGRVAQLRRRLTALETVQAVELELRQYDEETAALVGLAPGETPMVPGLPEMIAQLQRLIDPPPAPVREPPRPGLVRVRVQEVFLDGDRVRRYPGIEDIDEKSAREAIKKKWAVPA